MRAHTSRQAVHRTIIVSHNNHCRKQLPKVKQRLCFTQKKKKATSPVQKLVSKSAGETDGRDGLRDKRAVRSVRLWLLTHTRPPRDCCSPVS